MKKLYTLLFALSLATVSAKADKQTIKHTVKKGETLSSIAHKHKTTITKIREANGLKKSDVIKYGKVLKVPTKKYAALTPTKKYVIKKGDTLSGIALKHKTSVNKIRQVNGLKANDTLKIGKVIKVPTKAYASNTVTAPTLSKYVIKKGDTLSGIAFKHKTSVKKIREANGLKTSDSLKIGKVLKVPGKAYVSNTVTAPASSKYVIKKGDTLSGIARKHKTTVAKLIKTNGLKTSDTLKIGKVLKVPGTTKTIRYTQKKKKSTNKKFVANLSNLETISLAKAKAKDKKQKERSFAFKDIFTSSKKKHADSITSLAKTKLGKRYVYGASGNKNTYDCSSFTKYVYKNHGITIPRTSIKQSKFGKYVKRSELQKGDLVFFDTSKQRKGYVNHVGIYLGNNKFIHASSAKKKVVITSLNKNFYSNRYKGARRPS